jgi:hypothetical protein
VVISPSIWITRCWGSAPTPGPEVLDSGGCASSRSASA